MGNLTGKTVFITGASSGIGEEMAYEAARQGAKVILSARREDKLNAVKKRCDAISGVSASVFKLDVSDPDSIDQTVNRIIKEMSTIDVLINNAGFGNTSEFLSFDMKKAESMFRVNVLGLFYVTQLVALHMAENKSGHIINVASIAGKVATPKTAVYSASKFAVIGFSNALRLELRPLNIQVTTVNPGPVDTDFFDQFDPEGDYLGKVKSFVLTPEKVAKKAINSIGTKRREINLPASMGVAAYLYQIFPSIGDFLTVTLFDKK